MPTNPINKTALSAKLAALVNDYISRSSDPSDVLLNTLSSKSLGEVNIIEVEYIDSLPNLDLYTSPSGMVYYVQEILTFAISSGNKWLTLDGRTLRTDTVIRVSYAWGNNSFGRLGDNTVVTKSSPVVVGGFTDWCHVSAGRFHSLGLRTNGTAWAWGCNSYGRLGDDTIVDKSNPVSVVGGFTDWCQVSAGNIHSLGLRTNGTAWGWGLNTFGNLGDGTTTVRSSPVSVVGGFTDWCQVSAGDHNLGIRTNGTAWAWGRNSYGQLGDGTIVSKSSPVSVVGGFTDWCQVSAGSFHSLGVRTNGTAWAWGNNSFGRLGNCTVINRSSPVSVVGGFTDWCQVSAGGDHSHGVRTNGTAWAWGSNYRGRLGDNTIVDKSSPVSVVGGFTDWCQVSAGGYHSLGLRANGTAWAWGCNACGQLGDDTIVSRSSPVLVAGGFTDWCQVDAGAVHNLGIRVI